MFPLDPNEMRSAMELASMQASLHVHTFNEMIDTTLSPDQLRALASMFEASMQNPHVAGQIYGQIAAILRIRHNSCHCGQDHAAEFDVDKAFANMAGPPPIVLTPEAMQAAAQAAMAEDIMPPLDPIVDKEKAAALRTLILDLRADVKTLGMTAAPAAQITYRHAQGLLDKMATMTLPVEITCNCDGDWHGGEHVSDCPRYVDKADDPNEKLI